MNPSLLNRINQTIRNESDQFTNNPLDRGGQTKYGVTQAAWAAAGKPGSVANCTYDDAVAIYQQTYWFKPKFDLIEPIDVDIANRLFDWGVTSGPTTGVKYLQRILNVLNRNGKDYADITADGYVGPATVAAMRGLVAKRGADGIKVLRGMLQSHQSVFYFNIAEKDPSQEAFEFGWQLNRAFGGV